jgi:lipopolysaccharide/colanic/teichoic acid biosynthesis glycosyltransferase
VGHSPAVKRGFDIAAATIGLVVALPILVVVAVAVRVSMGRPVLFRQLRPGLNGRPFEMVKFRTMLPATSSSRAMADDARRLTPLGRFLRRTSLDELPELINVLAGDMSLVGPRPLLVEYLDRYTPEQARRHLVRPGITGWAQVNGRNALTWEQRFALDTWYVDNWSIRLDLKILAMTVRQVVTRQGVSAEGHATMPDFTGGEMPDFTGGEMPDFTGGEEPDFTEGEEPDLTTGEETDSIGGEEPDSTGEGGGRSGPE